MRSEDDLKDVSNLHDFVREYYGRNNRPVSIYEVKSQGDEVNYFIRFLIDRKVVLEYRVVMDRGIVVAVPLLAIGPHFFAPGEFWDYENSQRFTLSPTISGARKNLELIDEFLASRS